MTISIMTAWWVTVAVVGAMLFISGAAITETRFKNLRLRRALARSWWVAVVLWVVVILLGIWLPVFIPGMY